MHIRALCCGLQSIVWFDFECQSNRFAMAIKPFVTAFSLSTRPLFIWVCETCWRSLSFRLYSLALTEHFTSASCISAPKLNYFPFCSCSTFCSSLHLIISLSRVPAQLSLCSVTRIATKWTESCVWELGDSTYIKTWDRLIHASCVMSFHCGRISTIRNRWVVVNIQ